MSHEREEGDVCQKAFDLYRYNLGCFAISHIPDEDGQPFELLKSRMHVAEELFCKCESPIEEIMAAVLPFVTTGYGYAEDDCGINPGFGAVVRAQFEIENFRLDFLVSFYCNGHERHIAIECDGHDFHEKTKTQAARDKKRDRILTGRGITLYRYTGSEIYRNPDQIAVELEDVFYHTTEDVMADAAVAPRRRKTLTPDANAGAPQ